MAVIAKHNSEEEWERDNGKGSWVSFLVVGDSVGVHDSLEEFS
jgi:hypothetical protein